MAAPSRAAARHLATACWRDPDGGELRVVRAGTIPRHVLLAALAADGRALLGDASVQSW